MLHLTVRKWVTHANKMILEFIWEDKISGYDNKLFLILE